MSTQTAEHIKILKRYMYMYKAIHEVWKHVNDEVDFIDRDDQDFDRDDEEQSVF